VPPRERLSSRERTIDVIASEAKQSTARLKKLDCFVASAPRNDDDKPNVASGAQLHIRNDSRWIYPFGRLSNTRFALPSERSSVSGATARTCADMPMVFLI
jgi:hypothetical protein